jgi:hypothetical protein
MSLPFELRSSPIHGQGVFALRRIHKGRRLIEYVGERITPAEADQRCDDYLTGQQDAAYRDRVFAYVEKEDSPRSLAFQLDLLRAAGFAQVDVLHKHGPFAAFGGMKG